MRLRILAFTLGLALAAGPPGWAADDPVWHTSVAEASRAALASDRDILVDFYADWCLWCKKIDERIFSTEEFVEATAGEYVYLRVDVDEEEGEDLQRRFRVSNLPTVLLMTPNRIEIGRVEGYAPPDRYLAEIEATRQRYQEFLARYEEESGSTDRDTLLRLARDLYDRGDGLRAASVYRRVLADLNPASPLGARLSYEVAESLRRGGDLTGAQEALEGATANVRKAELEDSDLGARLALLRFHIAHDRGECQEAVGNLESFLDRYPESPLAPPARSTLHRLKRSESCA